ncbi:MAG: helix-turn-helix domain-containing protein [Bacteroidota bacterium]
MKKSKLNTILELIGKKFSHLRKRKGYTSIKNFADDYDLPAIQYWRIEKGRTNLTVKTLLGLLAIHKLSIEDFFCDLKKLK